VACRSTNNVANRALTLAQNILLGQSCRNYHSGYRGFTRFVIEALPLERNSDDFVFDNQDAVAGDLPGFPIGEISCPHEVFRRGLLDQISSASVIYGMGC